MGRNVGLLRFLKKTHLTFALTLAETQIIQGITFALLSAIHLETSISRRYVPCFCEALKTFANAEPCKLQTCKNKVPWKDWIYEKDY